MSDGIVELALTAFMAGIVFGFALCALFVLLVVGW